MRIENGIHRGVQSIRHRARRRVPATIPMARGLLAVWLWGTVHGAAAQGLEEVIVRAQKRDQSLQDVGITVTAMSGERLESLGLRDTQALAEKVPNVSIHSPAGDGGVSVLFIRGVGLNDFATNNSGPVGFYVDDVYVGSSNVQSATLFDIDRVEILKGPQGTLYGRNTTGGAISVFSRRPTREPEGYLRLDYGDYETGRGRYQLDAALSGPLSDSVAGRLAVTTGRSDGYMKNLVTGDYVEKSSWSARGQLDWTVTDRTSVLLNLHGSDTSSDADLYNSSLDDDFYAGTSDINPKLNLEQAGASLTISHDIGNRLEFVSITAYDELDKLHQEDADMLPLPLIHTEYGVDSETFSQEFRLSGDTDRGHWIAGLFYFDEDLTQDQGLNLTGIGLPVPYSYNNVQELSTWALFGQYELDISDSLKFTVGLRYTDLEVDFTSRGQGTFFVDRDAPGGVTDSYAFAGDLGEDDVSGRLGLDWKPADEVLLYVSLSKGFKGAGFNGNFHIDADAVGSYDSEEMIAWEAGIKTRLLDNTLQFNAAAFLYDYSDAQIFNNAPIPGVGLPSNSIRNADVDSAGLDLDVSWRPVEGVYLQLGVGYVDATYDENVEDPVTGLLPIEGNQVQNTPEWSAFLLASREWQLGGAGSLTLQFDAVYTGDVYYSTFEDIAVGQESYTLTNARIAWRSRDEHLEVALWGKNLSDKEYATYAFDLRADFGFLQRMRGVPRTLGIEAKYSF